MSAGVYRRSALPGRPDAGKLLGALVYFGIGEGVSSIPDPIAHVLVAAHAVATGRRSRAALQSVALHAWDKSRPKYGPEASAPPHRPEDIEGVANDAARSLDETAIDTHATIVDEDPRDSRILLLPPG